MQTLGADDWLRVLHKLATELPPTAQRHVTVIGGVAMALGYGSRRTTTDADVVIPSPSVAVEVLAAADRIADVFGLPVGWMNQKAIEAGKILSPQPDHIVINTPTLVLEVPSREHMLAMKLARFAGNTDMADAKILLQAMRSSYTEPEGVWTQIGGLVPVAQREQTRYNLFKFWEDLYESA